MPYSVLIQYDTTDKIYVASVPELEGCMAHGDTREEAMKEIQLAIELHLDVMRDMGMLAPEPLTYAS